MLGPTSLISCLWQVAHVPFPSKISFPFSANGNFDTSGLAASTFSFSSETGFPNLSAFLSPSQLTKNSASNKVSGFKIVFIFLLFNMIKGTSDYLN
jgi:hypothetical protein